jgi:hypothetical protein
MRVYDSDDDEWLDNPVSQPGISSHFKDSRLEETLEKLQKLEGEYMDLQSLYTNEISEYKKGFEKLTFEKKLMVEAAAIAERNNEIYSEKISALDAVIAGLQASEWNFESGTLINYEQAISLH